MQRLEVWDLPNWIVSQLLRLELEFELDAARPATRMRVLGPDFFAKRFGRRDSRSRRERVWRKGEEKEDLFFIHCKERPREPCAYPVG